MARETSERWSSRRGFILATIGSAVGLGSIWKFPYEVGENGGGGFLIFYLLGLLFVVFPLLVAEFIIGRRGRGSAATSIRRVAMENGCSPRWEVVGLFGIAGGFLILTYYAVIAGMTMAYVPFSLTQGFEGTDAAKARHILSALTGSPMVLASWQAAFLAIAIAIVARGIESGVEAACRVLMPTLALLMVVLIGYAFIKGDVPKTIDFILQVKVNATSPRAALEALGLGFFSIGVGMGLMITYAAYSGEDFDLSSVAIATIVGDTVISVLAGFAIFPIVFANRLDPDEGANIMFVTLPVAARSLRFGDIVGAESSFCLSQPWPRQSLSSRSSSGAGSSKPRGGIVRSSRLSSAQRPGVPVCPPPSYHSTYG